MGALLLRSSLLSREGFAHGFSLRTGGVSGGDFDSLNLGRTVGDDRDRVAENRARFARAAGAPAAFYEVSQVHGSGVRAVRPGDSVEAVRSVEADALVADAAGVGVAVRTADCLPVLLADRRTGRVAAVHAGWRGVVARVVDRALDELLSFGSAPDDLLAALGPHIRRGAFEVGEDVAAQIAAAAEGRSVIEARQPRPHADLAEAVRGQLAARGLGATQVEDVGGCTLQEPARFFSHRRDQGRTGRHLALIVRR